MYSICPLVFVLAFCSVWWPWSRYRFLVLVLSLQFATLSRLNKLIFAKLLKGNLYRTLKHLYNLKWNDTYAYVLSVSWKRFSNAQYTPSTQWRADICRFPERMLDCVLPYQMLALRNVRNTGTANYLPRPLPCAQGLPHKNFVSSENYEEKKTAEVSYHVAQQ